MIYSVVTRIPPIEHVLLFHSCQASRQLGNHNGMVALPWGLAAPAVGTQELQRAGPALVPNYIPCAFVIERPSFYVRNNHPQI